MGSVDHDKNILRQKSLSRRMQISAEERAAFSLKISENFFKSVPLPENGAVVSGYTPVNAEADPREILLRLNKMGYTTTLPSPIDNEQRLAFLRWGEGTKMRISIYGIPEPDTDNPADEFVPDFLIMPLLAFDTAGGRIGYGSGNFDRTFDYISEIKPFFTVAVAYESQRVDHVPMGTHDRFMDMIVTEEKVYDFRKAKA